MNWTAKDFENYLNYHWSFKKSYYTINGVDGFFSYLWNEATVVETGYGVVERVDTGTDYNDGREERTMIIKVDNRYFKKVGYYDSWESSSWDGTLTEVRPREKTVTVYETV
jgi:hypothetical protein